MATFHQGTLIRLPEKPTISDPRESESPYTHSLTTVLLLYQLTIIAVIIADLFNSSRLIRKLIGIYQDLTLMLSEPLSRRRELLDHLDELRPQLIDHYHYNGRIDIIVTWIHRPHLTIGVLKAEVLRFGFYSFILGFWFFGVSALGSGDGFVVMVNRYKDAVMVALLLELAWVVFGLYGIVGAYEEARFLVIDMRRVAYAAL